MIIMPAGGVAVNGSRYETSRRTIQLTDVDCNRNEQALDQCDKRLLTPAEGVALAGRVPVAGVKCVMHVSGTSQVASNTFTTMIYVGINVIIVVLILIIARYFYRKSNFKILSSIIVQLYVL